MGAARRPSASKAPKRNALAVGYTVPWIAKAFGLTQYRVRQALADVAPVGTDDKVNLYSLRDAFKMLSTPSLDWDEIIRTKKHQLPARLQKEIWDARRSEQEFRKEAGELWATDVVLDLYGQSYNALRSQLRIFPDNLARHGKLTAEQREIADAEVDEMLMTLHREALRVARANAGKGTALAEFEAELQAADGAGGEEGALGGGG